MTVSQTKVKELKKAAELLHKNDKPYSKDSDARFWLFFVTVVAFAFAFRLFIAEPVLVDGSSMFPNLIDGERMFVEKVSLWAKEPERGEVIICFYPHYTVTCVKRVIAIPGDRIRITDGYVYVNDQQIDESAYWDNPGEIDLDMGEVTIAPNTVFVIGDNRNDSKDSRAWGVGPIPYERVVGRAKSVIWPLYSIRSIS